MVKTIYKKDSSGKIRFLEISAKEGTVIQTSGVVGTDNPVTNISQCEPKNVGKMNSTTAEEQAVLEANSKLTEKMRLGYFETMEEAEAKGGSSFLLPMLAKDYKKEVKKVKFPCYVQPKLDGMRSLGNSSEEVPFVSRTGKPVDTLSHIDVSFAGEDILDGELYAHGMTFQENMKLLKKYRKGETEKIQYHVYDIVSELPFEERYAILLGLATDMPNIHIVETHVVHNQDEIVAFHQQFIAAGYEGTMIRHSEEGYQVNKRSSQLLKYKDFLDEAYRVIDILPSEARPEQGVVVCQMAADKLGVTFSCGMKFSHEAREEILRNKHMYIGQMAEIRFFEYTDGGIPRFPVCVGFRFDK